jgi:hypothetical protein
MAENGALALGRRADGSSAYACAPHKEEIVTAAGEARTFEECLVEIRETRQGPDHDNWKGETRPNKGPEVTPEMFQMSDGFLDGWARKAEKLFSKRPIVPER